MKNNTRKVNAAMDEYFKKNHIDYYESLDEKYEMDAIKYAAEKLNMTVQEVIWELE